MVDDPLLISDLAERAGVSVRTIRFYISEGLLPPPQAHGRYSVYDEEYLTRIELIKLLKNAFLPLKNQTHGGIAFQSRDRKHAAQIEPAWLPCPVGQPSGARCGAPGVTRQADK